MSQQTTMDIYQGIVLECQRCYMICRYEQAAARHNCPACGLHIANWPELTEVVREKMRQKHGSTSA